MRYKLLSSLFLVTLMAGCLATTPPKPNTEGPIHTLGGGFLVESGKLKYGLTYKSQSLANPSFAIIEFENPENSTIPLKTDLGQLDLTKNIIAQSPLFGAIKNNKNYTVFLYIYGDQSKTELVHRHVDQVQFRMPENLAKQVGIELL